MKRIGVANLRFSQFVVAVHEGENCFYFFVKLSWDSSVCTM